LKEWYWKDEESNNDIPFDPYYPITQDIDLHAHFEAITYTITYAYRYGDQYGKVSTENLAKVSSSSPGVITSSFTVVNSVNLSNIKISDNFFENLSVSKPQFTGQVFKEWDKKLIPEPGDVTVIASL
jgi:hypothetical protein